MSMTNYPIFLFDLDGTACDPSHRLHFLENKEDPERWDKFYPACIDDAPHPEVLELIYQLACPREGGGLGCEIWFVSGRRGSTRNLTEEWFEKHMSLRWAVIKDNVQFFMRRDRDLRPDTVIKEGILNSFKPEDRARILGVFEDRDSVVEMWRRNGLRCYQVASGNF